MLIITLTIQSFTGGQHGEPVNMSDFAAVFPLLVVSVFTSQFVSRSMNFYYQQRPRGDIVAIPENLCEPGRCVAAASERSGERAKRAQRGVGHFRALCLRA
jgi:hypothetical protein